MRVEHIVRWLDELDELLTPLRHGASRAGLLAAVFSAGCCALLWPVGWLAGLILLVLLPASASAAYHLVEALFERLRAARLRPAIVAEEAAAD